MATIIKNIKAAFGDLEMVPYKVIVERGGYEERLYPPKKWVCTTMKGTDQMALVSPMFRKLFTYISGKNEPNIRIDMTSPVTTLVEPSLSLNGESTFTMGFCIPEDHQHAPPPPGDKTIFIEERPEIRILTRRFGGYTTNEILEKEAKDLHDEIIRQGEPGMHFGKYYVVGYDPPFKPFGRRNEIWYVQDKPKQENDTEQDLADEIEDLEIVTHDDIKNMENSASEDKNVENVASKDKNIEIVTSEDKEVLKNGDVVVNSVQTKVEEAIGRQID